MTRFAASVLAITLGSGPGAVAMEQNLLMGSGSFSYSLPHAAFRWQNQSLLQIIREIDRAQAGKRLTPDEGSDEMLRRARSGEMYGLGACE